MFTDFELDILARVYARILAWPDPDEERADIEDESIEPTVPDKPDETNNEHAES